MSKLHDLAVKALCAVTPVKQNRVVFCSYYGRGYSDSPKAICEVLRQSGEDLDLIWLCKDEAAEKSLPEGVRPVPVKGMKKIQALASAKVWVDNCRKYENMKRKNQVYLQTWHGFALKKLEKDAESSLEPEYLQACKTDSAQCDAIVTGSGFMEKPRPATIFSIKITRPCTPKSARPSACRRTGSWPSTLQPSGTTTAPVPTGWTPPWSAANARRTSRASGPC